MKSANSIIRKSMPVIILVIFSFLVNLSLGYTIRPIYTFTLFFLLVILNKYNFLYRSIVIFLLILSALYFPMGLIYGPPSFNSVLSLYYTNKGESLEFLSAIPVYYFISSIIVIIIGVLSLKLSVKISNKKFIWFSYSFIFLSILSNPIKIYVKENHLDLLSTRFPPIRFFCEIYLSNLEVKQQYKEQKELLSLSDDWKPSIGTSKYDTYIVVIGESVRKDMMNSYGFSLKNTPFMSKTNGVLFNNYISTAPSTVLSLTNSFSLREDNKLEVNNNIVSLAKKSGYYTYWISNQGMLGIYDTAISAIGQKANNYFFSNKGEYNYIKSSDNILIPNIINALNEKRNKKIIFVHLIGSHADHCERTQGEYDEFYLNKDMSCYIQSIKNTDHLLSKIVDIANKENKKWSMMYFSDHGVSFYNEELKDKKLTHGDKYKQNYQVPFFIASYDSNERSYINSFRSGFDFLSIFSEWIGVREPRIKNNCNYMSNDYCSDDIKVIDFDNKIKDYNSLPDEVIND
ncbi:putative Similar to membrane protein YbiP of Escherichia coli [Xenorhabdus bovienii str. feltiae Florida]|nr:putative Similar to membrane protein YbiP of Escherichia coli [Xenorhabdus bovienii str. feltiae France]CDG92100.1 putative Similar to membrane protein YbiP of Escherichia coli [Xenorhabdus bovienii str. feltiae Florida]